MSDLFDHALQQRMKTEAPLAARMRPRTLEEFVGQEHIIGKGKLLRRAIEADRLFSSIILWGPPGTGKTTLAQVIANTTKSRFVTISAILAGKADLREIIEETLERRRLHIKALISRSRVFQLRNLNQEEIGILMDRALTDKERGYGNKRIVLDPDARAHLIEVSSGDVRNALNALELAVESTPPNKKGIIHITLDVAQESIQRRAVLYDKDGDVHYDTISAFIKSVRGSDPDAALYWLAKMLYAGEDPRFIIRRLIILAGEDIGLADPMGLVVASSAAQAFDYIGLPEGVYPIVEATLYLSTAPKSNSAGAYFKAMKKIEDEGLVSVPRHLQDSNRDAAAMGHGKDYVYPHEHEGHFIPQQYLPKRLLGTYFYRPSGEGYEEQVATRLEMWREAQRKALGIERREDVPELSEEKIQEMKRRIK